jgi:HK97 family phage prohead protease
MPRFTCFIPLSLTKGVPIDGSPVNPPYLEGIASTTSLDRDDERMSSKALSKMMEAFNTQSIAVFGNHEHSWENTLGYVSHSSLNENNLAVKIALEDPVKNDKVAKLLSKLEHGTPLGLSVGGDVKNSHDEKNKSLGKVVTVYDDVELYELSVVGIPSNRDASLSIARQIAKSLKEAIVHEELKACVENNECDVSKAWLECWSKDDPQAYFEKAMEGIGVNEDEVNAELAEHPWLTHEQAVQIVLDHQNKPKARA